VLRPYKEISSAVHPLREMSIAGLFLRKSLLGDFG
jgi:hypothetical protein